MLFFNRGNTEGTNSSKILCLTFVYVLLSVNLCQDWFCVFREFVVWWLVWRVDRRQTDVCFSPDVILCGWLDSKYQLTNELSFSGSDLNVQAHLRLSYIAAKRTFCVIKTIVLLSLHTLQHVVGETELELHPDAKIWWIRMLLKNLMNLQVFLKYVSTVADMNGWNIFWLGKWLHVFNSLRTKKN